MRRGQKGKEDMTDLNIPKDVGRDSENVELVGGKHGDAKIDRNYTVR